MGQQGVGGERGGGNFLKYNTAFDLEFVIGPLFFVVCLSPYLIIFNVCREKCA